MIELNGMIFGKKFEIKCESNVVCMAFQSRLQDLIDVQSKKGCPENCEYVVRKPEDKPLFVCDIISYKSDDAEKNKFETFTFTLEEFKEAKLNNWHEVTKEEIYNAVLMPGEYKEEDGKFYVKRGMLDGLICEESEVKTIMVNDAMDLVVDLFDGTGLVDDEKIEETKFERTVAESIDYNKIRKARKIIRKAFDSDEQFKWGYICNIAMHLYDEICKDGLELDYNRRNEIAKKMLKVIFYSGEE